MRWRETGGGRGDRVRRGRGVTLYTTFMTRVGISYGKSRA